MSRAKTAATPTAAGTDRVRCNACGRAGVPLPVLTAGTWSYCTYPWFALNGTDSAFTHGADYPGTQFDYGQAAQFATTVQCGGPFGTDSTYCDTVISPTP